MRQRDRYIDFLRAFALIRVMTYHTFGWAWLPLAFPSMGIMFALGGGLVAASLDRAGSARAFLRKRVRRLLPPFWVFGAVMVAVMVALGWQVDSDLGQPFSWSTIWLWLLPLSDPPSSAQGFEWVVAVWYIRIYLWFLLLSPAMLWLFRRWPLRMMALPPVVLIVTVLGLVELGGRTYDNVVLLAAYACCWMLGFAHHDGKLRELPLKRTLLAGVALLGIGLWYALTHQEQYGTYNIDDIPLANMPYCLGAVLILLRIYPRFTWLERLPTLGAVISLFNSRAMTIYLWGNFAIAMSPIVLGYSPLAQYDTDDARGMVVEYATAWTLVFVAVLAVGWVEDVGAGRRPRLLPWDRVRPVPASRPAPELAPVRQVVFQDNVVQDRPAVEQPVAEPQPQPLPRPAAKAQPQPQPAAKPAPQPVPQAVGEVPLPSLVRAFGRRVVLSEGVPGRGRPGG
ncbi:acyltransferase family protein [Geodermatophilus sabuli]|uniref:Acyltransferase family protein n=1 Tax=Geodermatophilus sabuli TaxID=1564158 RepID=A0A7K3W2D2_9ACTN|nr:acyltransferase family protein [Geodermatophilus sabuli]NEK59049.1 acyltransferase family protein [Geodermatophilus sabuli]